MEEKEKGKKIVEESEGANKRDFLKVIGAGLGVAGLASMMGGQSFAQEEKKGKYVIVITHGGNDPNRAIFGLLMAQTVADKGWGKVYVWVTLDGADLVNKKKTERIESPIYKKFGNALEIIKKIKDKGGWFGVCPPCAEYFGATGSDKYDWVELAGGDWLMKNIQDAWVVWIRRSGDKHFCKTWIRRRMMSLFRKKEDINRVLPHLRLSSENWSDSSVGCTQSTTSLTRSQPVGGF